VVAIFLNNIKLPKGLQNNGTVFSPKYSLEPGVNVEDPNWFPPLSQTLHCMGHQVPLQKKILK
jgi:hypothetical protein